jgi:hypothetical protein
VAIRSQHDQVRTVVVAAVDGEPAIGERGHRGEHATGLAQVAQGPRAGAVEGHLDQVASVADHDRGRAVETERHGAPTADRDVGQPQRTTVNQPPEPVAAIALLDRAVAEPALDVQHADPAEPGPHGGRRDRKPAADKPGPEPAQPKFCGRVSHAHQLA